MKKRAATYAAFTPPRITWLSAAWIIKHVWTATHRKFGADAHSNARHAKSTAAYANRKNTVTIGAMVLTFCMRSKICISSHVTVTATYGFPVLVVFVTGRKIIPAKWKRRGKNNDHSGARKYFFLPNSSSRASASKILDAPIIWLNMADVVDAKIPITTNGDQAFMLTRKV